MNIIFVYNTKNYHIKIATILLIIKLISKSKKTIVLDFDFDLKNSSLIKDPINLNILEKISLKKMSSDNLWIKMNLNKTIDNDFEQWIDDLILKINSFDFVLINSASSNGVINNKILSITNNIIYPFLFDKNNLNQDMDEFISMINTNQIKTNMFFIPFIFQSNLMNDSIKLLDVKKIAPMLFIGEKIIIKSDNFNVDKTINNKEIKNAFKNIINLLKIHKL